MKSVSKITMKKKHEKNKNLAQNKQQDFKNRSITMTRKSYKTDLTDQQWKIIKPLLPPSKSKVGRGRKRTIDTREIVNAILYWSRSGCPWELLPHDFPHYKTVHSYFLSWQKKGIWKQIYTQLKNQNTSRRKST